MLSISAATGSEAPCASHGLAFDAGTHESHPAPSVAVQASSVAGSPEFLTQKLMLEGLAPPSRHSK